MMKKIGVIAAFAAAALSVSAEVITFNTAQDWEKHPRVKFTADGIMEMIGGRINLSSKQFDIDPAKRYVFTAEIRTKEGKNPGIAYIGNYSISADGTVIAPNNILLVRKSESKLLVDAPKGSNTIVITKPVCWNAKSPDRIWCVAMDTKSDFSDVPNRNLYSIAKATVDGDKVTLTLRQKLTSDYKAGTATRFHRASGSMYGGMRGKLAPTEWQKLTWTVKGQAPISSNPSLRWWYSAKKGSLLFISNYKYAKNSVLQVRNVQVEVFDK